MSLNIGLAAGVLAILAILLLKLIVRGVTPADVAQGEEFKLVSFIVQAGIGILLQAIAAFVAATRVKPTGTIHGLLTAFVAGTVAAIGLIGLNLAFGGTAEIEFIWLVYGIVVTGGALIALPFALIGAFLARWVGDQTFRTPIVEPDMMVTQPPISTSP
jgi:hypothetical protein